MTEHTDREVLMAIFTNRAIPWTRDGWDLVIHYPEQPSVRVACTHEGALIDIQEEQQP